ncbi:voltage-gated potassium channel [Aureococcus anophagefferens]|nr:voltage-gated potassium channel [Aureococcus anophagefferens]
MTDDGRRGSIDASPLDAAAPSPLTSAAGGDDELYEQALGALASSTAPGRSRRGASAEASEEALGILEKPKPTGSRMAAWKRRAELAMTAQHMARKAHQRRQKDLDDRERLRIAAASSMSGKKPEEYNAEEARAKVHGDTLERSLARADAACCGKKADAPREKRRKKGRGYLDRNASQTENMMLRLAMMSSAREASRFSVHPESRLVQRESYAIILAMLFTVVEMPLSLGFGDDAVNRGPVMPGVLCALDMLFIADVALNCVTGVQDGPEIVMQQPRILARYLKGVVFKLARLAKVTRVGEVTRNLVDSGFVNQAFVSLVALLVLFGAVQHWLACLYWAVARRTEHDWGKDEAKARGFAPAADLADEPLGARLVFAYHWAVYATYAAVPNTMGTLRLKPAQSLYCVFCALVGMLFMSVLIGEVASILDDIRIEDHDKQAALKSIDEFMNHHNIAYELRARIRLHYIFLYNNKHTRRFDDIFAVLPAELKSKLSVGVRVPYLRQTSCFVDLRPTCVSAVAAAMVTTHYAPMDLVFSQSEDADGVRCIADGNVFHFIRGLPWPKVIAATKVDDTFGEECVLLMKSRMFVYGTMAHVHCEIFCLPAFEVAVLGHQYPTFNPSVYASAERKLAALQLALTRHILAPRLHDFVVRWKRRHEPAPRPGFSRLGSQSMHDMGSFISKQARQLSVRVAPLVMGGQKPPAKLAPLESTAEHSQTHTYTRTSGD